MKLRENWTYRKLDFACPRAALDELHDLEMAEIKAGTPIRTEFGGPLGVGPGRVSGTAHHRVMLIDEKHADRIIAQIEAICAKYPDTDVDYGKYPKSWREED